MRLLSSYCYFFVYVQYECFTPCFSFLENAHHILLGVVYCMYVQYECFTGVANDKEKGRGVEGPEAAVIS